MLRLQETDRFLRDYKRYQKDINRIESLSVKEYALQLLNELKTHCNLIDEAHNSRNNGYIDPRNIRDNIEKSVQIRKELNTIIKDSREG
jgi:hypothetical protein